MKKLISLFLLISFCLSVSSQKHSDSVAFTFPFKPGSTEWKRLKTTSARIAALQIPEDILVKLSTNRILEACLDFPYTYDMFTYNDYDLGFTAISQNFNGFKELLRRKDLADVLLDKYEKMSLECMDYSAWQDKAKNVDMPSFRIYLIVYMTGLDIVINNMSDSQLKRLETVSEYNLKHMEGNTTFDTMVLCTVKRMQNHLKRIRSLQDYSEGNIFYGRYGNYRTRIKHTPNGSPVISGELITSDLSMQQKTDYRYLAEVIHGATYVSEATKQYNCHAYAWHISEGHPDDLVWIGFGNDTTIAKQRENIYWEDGSYIEVPEAIATHISYDEGTADHSAKRYDSTRYISKWGLGCLVIHLPNEVPYNTSQPKKYYIRNNFAISGSTVVCDSTQYHVENLLDNMSVTWSVNNNRFKVTPFGNQCKVTYDSIPRYDIATLSAIITYNNDTILSLTKRIVMHGTDMYVEGVQAGIYDENGDMPAVAATFTIPASSGMRGAGNRLSMINRASLEMTSIPVVFENTRLLSIPDNPTYGITEIYGGADIFLDGARLDGMTISFSGDRAPEYLYSDGGSMISFRMPEVSSITDVQGYYYVVLHATSEGGCHDFDLYFKVIPVEGESIGAPEISLYFTDSSVRVDFDAMEWEELPGGMLQATPWYLRIFRMSTGTQMHYSMNMTESKTVDISTWPADVYIVRVDSGDNRYIKKFLKH